MGRRVRRLPRTYRGSSVSPLLQRSHFRSRHRRLVRRLCACAGGRAIVELMYADFIGCAGDEIFNQLSKWQAMSAGILKMPVVRPRFRRLQVRRTAFVRTGPRSARTFPDLRSFFPATPYDAKGLMTRGAQRHRPGYILREPAHLRYRRAVP